MKTIYRIAQIGTFDLENYGDLLFPVILENELKKRIQNVEIVLFSPIGGNMPFYGKKICSIDQIEYEHLKRNFDVIIIGGGDIIRLDANVAADDKYPAHEKTANLWIFPILFAQKYDIPVLFNAPGVPFALPNEKFPLLKEILKKVSYLSTRDNISANFIKKVDDELQVTVVPDTVFLLKRCYSKELLDKVYDLLVNKIQMPKRYLLFQLNHLENGVTVEEYSDILTSLEAEIGMPILLFPIGYIHEDSLLLDSISFCSGNHFRKIDCKLSPIEMAAVISHSSGFIGTSYHGCLTSHLFGVPTIVVNDARLVKIEGYFNFFHTKENICYSIKNIKANQLKCNISIEEINRAVEMASIHMDRLAEQIVANIRRPEIITSIITELVSYSFYKNKSNANSEIFGWGTVYWDLGEDFNENISEKIPIFDKKGKVKWIGEIPKGARRIRFDPIEGASCIVTALVVMHGEEILLTRPLNGFRINEFYCFDNIDPQIEIEMPVPLEGEITIEANIFVENYAFVKSIASILKDLNCKINEIGETAQQYRTTINYLQKDNESLKNKMIFVNNELENQKESNKLLEKSNIVKAQENYELSKQNEILLTAKHDLYSQISALESKYQALQDEYQRITDSKSWKYTAIFRKIAYFVKKMSGEEKDKQ